ncbi:hypothetical protein [Pseudodesulfovibrio tunisiensis]|uniref:hypothetical protein n=1 Tax=Pseudodesulfovibrio tunisiensis TaxID=463192 RepID=UPI001FB3AA53|nr:hypothetical protein [Pseudodesulfovibrio tunisiensis]
MNTGQNPFEVLGMIRKLNELRKFTRQLAREGKFGAEMHEYLDAFQAIEDMILEAAAGNFQESVSDVAERLAEIQLRLASVPDGECQ